MKFTFFIASADCNAKLLASGRGREVHFSAKDKHHLWQRCIIRLPAIDFELEMLVYCIVNGMRFSVVPSSSVSCYKLGNSVTFPFRKARQEIGRETGIIFFFTITKGTINKM